MLSNLMPPKEINKSRNWEADKDYLAELINCPKRLARI